MNKLLLFILTLTPYSLSGQTIDRYFETIRNNSAQLTAFFSQMPKGGDLHNHYSGSVYTETYISYVIQQDYAINEQTLEVKTAIPKGAKGWSHFSKLKKEGRLAAFEQKLMQKWSAKDYNGVSYPSDKLFFETFPAFDIATKGPGCFDSGLLELKRRAQIENVSYIELMFTSIPCGELKNVDTNFNHQLLQAQLTRDEALTASLLEKLFNQIIDKNGRNCAARHNNDIITDKHNRLHIDDSTFTMRYQNYVLCVIPPVDIFKAMVVAFESANTSPLVVGVNIVAPEDNEVALRDFWMHMQMYKFCHKKFPNVKYAIHAGELTLGLVKPEELTWHINAAVYIAGASRIGHGVDMAYENNRYDLLRYMARNKVAIEINLYSNEFILKVKDDEHPISLYRDFNVPIVISSDDAGILRSNLTHQYVLLAKRYKDISYHEIKEYVFNSIDYSFIKEERVKARLKNQLREDFYKFERDVLTAHKY